jgi:hypothetical protein
MILKIFLALLWAGFIIFLGFYGPKSTGVEDARRLQQKKE